MVELLLIVISLCFLRSYFFPYPFFFYIIYLFLVGWSKFEKKRAFAYDELSFDELLNGYANRKIQKGRKASVCVFICNDVWNNEGTTERHRRIYFVINFLYFSLLYTFEYFYNFYDYRTLDMMYRFLLLFCTKGLYDFV